MGSYLKRIGGLHLKLTERSRVKGLEGGPCIKLDVLKSYWRDFNQLANSSEIGDTIQNTIYFDVGTKNPKIIVDDYDFNMARKTDVKTMWICAGYFKTKCKARATTSGRMVYINGTHNHDPKQKRSKFTNMLSQAVSIIRNPVPPYPNI
ncbi:hypothetical protein JTB14_018865 [Gonioctena quinquepunctata]|nr:hypothetical protein JTB14_018865 [Gonioctena quinquepunctata]